MHRFFLTNNLGGGGTNVSRLYDYIELFQLKNIGILLNYYYLTGHADPAFDKSLISQIYNYTDLNKFIGYSRTFFSNNRNISSFFNSSCNDVKINGFILDNGCGNFLRNLLNQGTSHNHISNYVKPFLDFAEKLGFDLSVALDLAMKYTYKADEMADEKFKEKWTKLASDNNLNLSLLEASLKVISTNNYKHCILAPLHGYNVSSFCEYMDKIISLENKYNAKFGGFALGGIADTRRLDSTLWIVPPSFKRYKKSAYLCYKLIKAIRDKTDRHIHVLGAGSIYTLPFLIKAGASSSDCHSAWRRSSDGGIYNAKILVPLMNRNFDFINDKKCLEYVKICDIHDGLYNFNCGFSVKQLQNMLKSQNKEDFYFAELVIFYEAILQYDILLEYINTHPDNYLDFLSNSLDTSLNNSYKAIMDSLNL